MLGRLWRLTRIIKLVPWDQPQRFHKPDDSPSLLRPVEEVSGTQAKTVFPVFGRGPRSKNHLRHRGGVVAFLNGLQYIEAGARACVRHQGKHDQIWLQVRNLTNGLFRITAFPHQLGARLLVSQLSPYCRH
jgi:hypothetical protein